MHFRDLRWRHIGRLWLGVAAVGVAVVLWQLYGRPPQRGFWLVPYDAGLIFRGVVELTRREPVFWVGVLWLPVTALVTTAIWLVVRRDRHAGTLVESREPGA
jgi:hypothetical protein